jgi:hypothetical protein
VLHRRRHVSYLGFATAITTVIFLFISISGRQASEQVQGNLNQLSGLAYFINMLVLTLTVMGPFIIRAAFLHGLCELCQADDHPILAAMLRWGINSAAFLGLLATLVIQQGVLGFQFIPDSQNSDLIISLLLSNGQFLEGLVVLGLGVLIGKHGPFPQSYQYLSYVIALLMLFNHGLKDSTLSNLIFFLSVPVWALALAIWLWLNLKPIYPSEESPHARLN